MDKMINDHFNGKSIQNELIQFIASHVKVRIIEKIKSITRLFLVVLATFLVLGNFQLL